MSSVSATAVKIVFVGAPESVPAVSNAVHSTPRFCIRYELPDPASGTKSPALGNESTRENVTPASVERHSPCPCSAP